MLASDITREIGWNSGLTKGWMIAVDMLIAAAVAVVAVWLLRRRIKLWRVGKAEKRTDHLIRRTYSAIVNGLGQKSLLKDPYPGLLHAMLFFGFAVLVPFAFRFLLGFRTENLQPMISAGNYFAFVIKLVIAFGIVFQLPLVISLLTWAGFVRPGWLLKHWRIALVIIAACSALLTPPDIASQMLMAIPVTSLYFLSALLSLLIARRKKNRDREVDEDEDEGATS